MPITNTIGYREEWVPILDEIYQLSSLSGVLDSAPELVNLQAGEFRIPTMTLDGLADHTNGNGGLYVDGDVSLTWNTHKPTYNRNRKFQVDVMDDYDTAGLAFGRLSGVFIRERVVPEIDVVRFAKYSEAAETKVSGTISTPLELVTALKDGITLLEEAQVPQEGLHLFITPTSYNELMLMQTIDSKMVFDHFGGNIHKVPQVRFVTEVVLNDGKTAGQTKGGWVKGEDAKDINFLIIQRNAVIQGLKHVAPKYIPSGVNQSGDADAFAYRVVGIEEVFTNKKIGIYAHIKE